MALAGAVRAKASLPSLPTCPATVLAAFGSPPPTAAAPCPVYTRLVRSRGRDERHQLGVRQVRQDGARVLELRASRRSERHLRRLRCSRTSW
jgi:hypothetical protein